MAGRLYLVPNTLGGKLSAAVPPENEQVVRRLRYWVAENPKSARDFLKRVGTDAALQSIRIERLDKNTPAIAIPALLAPILAGVDAGLISEAGCPAIADPGSVLVRLAHESSIRVAPLVGPSSLTLALMGSGLEGQRFTFHGYLPVSEPRLIAKLRQLEVDSRQFSCTQIFIETPYRNQRLASHLLDNLAPDTLLCIASDLTLQSENIATRTISQWRHTELPVQDGHPTVFLLLAAEAKRTNEPSPNRGRRTSTGR